MKKLMLLVLVLTMVMPRAFGQILPPVIKQVTIGGTVMDDPYPTKRASFPIQGVKVVLWEPLAVILNGSGAAILPPVPLRRLVDSAVTDVQGKFVFKPAPVAAYQIMFDHPGYNSRQIDLYAAADTTFTVLMVAAGAKASVAGTVWAACSGLLGMPCILQPVAGCTVTVSTGTILPIGVQAIVYPIQPVSYQGVTNAQGQYTIDSIPVSVNGERVSVSAAKAGFVPQTVDTVIRNTVTTTVNFSLANNAIIRPDTVDVTPQQPTTLDSLTFLLFSTHHCCRTVFYDKIISVNDTMIFLSYRYDDSLCAFLWPCFMYGITTAFSSGPLAAGRYSIYKVESLYCPPGTVCPMIVTAPVWVGTVTVTPASGIRQAAGNRALVRGNCLTVAETSISATIARSARVTLRAYDVRGALIGEVFNGWMPAGTRHFNRGTVFSKGTARGTMLLVLTVDGVAIADKTVIISH